MNHRIKQLDLIREIAIGAVVLCHATERIYQFSVDSMVKKGMLNALAGFFFFTIGRLGVPFVIDAFRLSSSQPLRTVKAYPVIFVSLNTLLLFI